MIITCSLAFFCSVYSCFMLPSDRLGYLWNGLALITLYFLPMKWPRRILDHWLPIRWVYLSLLICGAGIVIAGDPDALFSALLLIVPLICGNLLICDLRDQEQDLANPHRSAFPGGSGTAKVLLGLLFLTPAVLILVQDPESAIPRWHWLVALFCGTALLWIATFQRQHPWRMTLLADLSPVIAAIILSLD